MQLSNTLNRRVAQTGSFRPHTGYIFRVSQCRTARQDALRELEQFRTGVSQRVQEAAVPGAAGGRGSMVVAAAAADVTAVQQQSGLLELNKDTYWEYMKEHADELTVVDFYTAWCGPCKLVLPDLERMASELAPKGVNIVKFNCNKDNKDFGQGLGIKVAPTFYLYKNSQKVAEMTGAKVDKLSQLIEQHMPQQSA